MAHTGLWWSRDQAEREIAKDICASCPVKEQCLADGKAHRDTGIIRGGVEL